MHRRPMSPRAWEVLASTPFTPSTLLLPSPPHPPGELNGQRDVGVSAPAYAHLHLQAMLSMLAHPDVCMGQRMGGGKSLGKTWRRQHRSGEGAQNCERPPPSPGHAQHARSPRCLHGATHGRAGDLRQRRSGRPDSVQVLSSKASAQLVSQDRKRASKPLYLVT